MTPALILTRAELDSIIQQTVMATADELASRFSQPAPDALWTAEQIGAYLGIAEATVAGKLAYQRGFPDAIALGDGPKARRRWISSEVIDWAMRQRERRAA